MLNVVSNRLNTDSSRSEAGNVFFMLLFLKLYSAAPVLAQLALASLLNRSLFSLILFSMFASGVSDCLIILLEKSVSSARTNNLLYAPVNHHCSIISIIITKHQKDVND